MWLKNGNDASRGGVTIVTPESRYPQVERDLQEIDEFLNSRTNLNERLSYRSCPTKRRRDVYSMLNDERNEITTEADTDEKKRVRYKTRVDILNAAASIYQFFLPVPVDGPIISKFWAALHQILEVRVPFQLVLSSR